MTQEITSERTAESRTYLTASGQYMTLAYAAPVNYQDQAGAWQAINPSLVPSTLSGYAWHDSANQVDVELPGSLGAAPTLVSNGTDWLSLGLQSAAAPGTVSTDTATYPNALPGVTVSYTSEDNELKESMVLASSAAPSSFTYSVGLASGDSLAADSSGGLELLGSRGQVVFDLPAATMTDGAGAEGGPVSMTAADSGSGWTITVTADPSWLQDPARVWPVTIDPSVTFSDASYCTLDSTAPNSSSCNTSSYTVSSIKNGIMQFPDVEGTIGAGSLVESAQLYLNETSANGTATVNLGAYGLNESSNGTATWNDRNTGTPWMTPGGTYDSSPTDSESESVTPTSQITWAFNVQSLVQAWVSGRIDDGILINETSGGTGLTFAGSGTEPYLAVTYENRLGSEPFFNISSHAIDDQETLGVNAANGNVIIDTSDYSVTGTGLSMQVQRTYNALSKRSGSLGLGWSLNMGPDVSLTSEPGDAYLLDDRNGANWLFTAAGGGGWTAPAGINASLSVSGSGMLLTYNASQEKLLFASLGGSCPGLALTTDTDRNQNSLTYTYASCNLYTVTLNRSGETLAEGRTWSVTSNPHNEITAITESNFAGGLNGSGSAVARSVGFGYDPTHTYLTSYTDANGAVTSYGYDSSGRLDRVTNPDGHIITLQYNAANRVSTVTYITDLATMTGDTTTYSYRANLLTANENSLASGTTAGWVQGSAASIAAVMSPVFAGTYSLAATAASGGVMQVKTYNGSNALPVEPGQPYQGALYVQANANPASVQAQLFWYNASQTLISTSSGTAANDSAGSWTQVTVGDTAPSTAAYVALGAKFSGTTTGDIHYLDLAWLNPGNTFMAQNSPQGLPYVMGAACGSGNNPLKYSMTASVWALAVNTQVDPNGNTTTYCYDGRDEVTTAVDGLGRGRQTSFTANSDVSTTTDAMTSPGVTTSTYDGDNRLTKSQAPATASGGQGRSISYGDYATSGTSMYEPGTATDTQGNMSMLGYDGAGNLKTVQNADGNTATTNHSTADGTIQNQTDYGGTCTGSPVHCTSYSYSYATTDPTVLTSLVTTPPSGLGSTTQTYDSDGRLSSAVNGNGFETVTCYDNDDRVTKVFYNVSVSINCVTTTSPTPAVTYTYDGDGNLTEKVDSASSSTTIFNYDNVDRPVTESTDSSHVCSAIVPGGTTYYGDSCVSYDANGNVATYTDSGGAVSYTYDAADENTSVVEPGASTGCSVSVSSSGAVTTSPAADCIAFAYNRNGVRIETLEPSPGDELITDTPDTSNRTVGIVATNAAGTIVQLSYTYTNASGGDSGLIRSVTKSVGGVTTTTTYGYGNENQLCWAATETGSGTPSTFGCTPPSGSGITVQSYTYDPFGNMASQTSTTGVTSYGNNQANQLCWSVAGTETNDKCSTTPPSATTYTFDEDGNETGSSAGFAGAYSASDQTTSLTNDTGGSPTAFIYPDAGQTHRLTAATAGTATTFLNSLTGVASSSAGSTTWYYTRDANGALLGMRNGLSGSDYYYTTDANGSIVAINDSSSSATTQASYSYDPYGVTTISEAAGSSLGSVNPWRYDGGYQDETGLYHFGARYYDPGTARWTQTDPSKESPGYQFAGDDPVNESDPTGFDYTLATLSPQTENAIAIAIGGGATAASAIVGALGLTAIGLVAAAIIFVFGAAIVTALLELANYGCTTNIMLPTFLGIPDGLPYYTISGC